MKHRIIIQALCVSLLLATAGSAQTNSVLLKNGAGTVLSSHSSITSAYSAIPSAITQAYIIEIDVAYNGSLETYPITFVAKTGASAVNLITLRPTAAVTSQLIQSSYVGTGMITLDDADYVVIDGRPGGTGSTAVLTLNNTNTASNANTLGFINGACFNVVRYCNILNSTTGNAGRNVFLSTSASNPTGNSDNVFRYCNLSGGRYQFNTVGTTGSANTRNTVFGCTFQNSTFVGFWANSGTNKTRIDSCAFFCTTPTGSGLYFGILFDSQNDSTIIVNNRMYDIQDLTTGTLRYIQVRSITAGSTSTIEISNNFISMMTGNTALTNIAGIEITGNNVTSARVVNNSIRIGGTQTGAGSSGAVSSAGLIITSSTSGAMFEVKNNILVNERTGGTSGVQHVAFSVSNATPVYTINNNTYNSITGDLVRWVSTAYTTIGAYQAVVPGSEPGANDTPVTFMGTNDLHLPCSSWTNTALMAPAMPGVAMDIDGDLRASVVFRGADEALAIRSIVPVGCNSAPTGMATVNPGPGAYSYTWLPSGGNAATATGLALGTHSVIVSNGTGCIKTQTLSIGQAVNFAVNATTQQNVSCLGVNNGSAAVAPSPAVGSYTYAWQPNVGSAATVSGLAPGNYTVTITNASQCQITKQFTITAPPTAFSVSISGNQLVCAGSPATLTATGSGGTGAPTYTWASGPASSVNVVSPAVATVYTVNSADANNCASSATLNVAVNPLPPVTVNNGSVCAGSIFTLNPGGAISYTFSNGSTTVSPAANASFTVTGSDASGCKNTAVSSVSVNALPLITVNSGSVCSGSSFVLNPGGGLTYTFSSGSATVAPTANTNYTVTGTDANNCLNQAVSSITVAALPTITVNSGAICPGASFTLVPGGGLTYTFSGGSNVVNPVTNTSYTVTGTGANTCVKMAVGSVTVNAIPVVSLTPASGTACIKSPAMTLTGLPPGGIYSGVQVSTNKFSPAATGTFSPVYSYTDAATGCTNSVSATIVVSECTGLSEAVPGSRLSVYPNPTSGELNFVFENTAEKTITVMDMTGRIVYSFTTHEPAITLQLESLAKGMYSIQVNDKQSVEILKIVKQ